MKYRKIAASVLCVLILALAGCSTASMDKGYVNQGAPESYDGLYSESASGDLVAEDSGKAQTSVETDRKLVKTVNIEAETEDLDALLLGLEQQVAAMGGYVENQNVYNGSAYFSGSRRYANMTVRIPAEQLSVFVKQMTDASNIVSKYENVDDVTLTYVDTQSRLDALTTEEARLLELMDQAGDLTELLEVESRLTDVRYEKESVASRLRVMENQVSYATVHLDVNEVEKLTPVEEKPFWQRVGGGMWENLKDIGKGIAAAAEYLLVGLPYFVLLGIIALAVWLPVRHHLRRKKKNQQPQ